MTRLTATFENSNGKKHRWSLKNSNPNKAPKEIKASLEKLTLLNIFDKEDVGLFKKVVTAKFVKKIETAIFDEPEDVFIPETTTNTQPKKSLNTATEPTTLYIPEDLVITEQRPEPNLLIQSIEMPKGLDPHKMNESQMLTVITACIPNSAVLEDIFIDEQTTPAKIVLIARLKSKEESVYAAQAQSPPN